MQARYDIDNWERIKVRTKALHVADASLYHGQRIIRVCSSTWSSLSVMFTPALTAFEAQFTLLPSPSLSLPALPQTPLIRAVRRDESSEALTNDHTCGYTSGAWSSAVTCGPQASCTYYAVPNAPNFGCCTQGQGCDYVSTCLDYGAKGNINTYAGVGLGGQKFMCGSLIPYCSTLVLYGQTYGPGSTQSYYYYSCQRTTAPPVIAFQTTFDERAASSTTASSTSTTTSSTTSPTSSTTISTTSSASNTPSNGSSVPNTSTPSSPSSQAVSSNVSNLTGADGTSSSLNLPSSSIAMPSATSTSEASSAGLSQTSQIGIAVGASIGVCILLAFLAFWFYRHRKAKADKRWLNQPPQNFDVYPQHMDSTKGAYPFDYRSNSQRTDFSGKSEGAVEATYELSTAGGTHELCSTGRMHELPTNH